MLTDTYSPGSTPVHSLSPGRKLLLLCLTCSALLILNQAWFTVTTALLLAVAYVVAGIPASLVRRAMAPALWVLGVLFLVQWWLYGLFEAIHLTLRLATMIMAASLLTLTTATGDLLAAIERQLTRWLPDRTAESISLAFSLTLRFIPRVRHTFEEVREAQTARGLGRDWRALATPTIVRTLKSADEIAEAIAARSPASTSPSPSRSAAESESRREAEPGRPKRRQ